MKFFSASPGFASVGLSCQGRSKLLHSANVLPKLRGRESLLARSQPVHIPLARLVSTAGGFPRDPLSGHSMASRSAPGSGRIKLSAKSGTLSLDGIHPVRFLRFVGAENWLKRRRLW